MTEAHDDETRRAAEEQARSYREACEEIARKTISSLGCGI